MVTAQMYRRGKSRRAIFLSLSTEEGFLVVKDRHQATNMTLPTLNETQFTHANPHQTLSTHTVLHPQNMSLAQISMMNNTLSRRSSILTTTVVGGPSTGAPGGGSSSPNPNNLLTNPRRLASMAVISYEWYSRNDHSPEWNFSFAVDHHCPIRSIAEQLVCHHPNSYRHPQQPRHSLVPRWPWATGLVQLAIFHNFPRRHWSIVWVPMVVSSLRWMLIVRHIPIRSRIHSVQTTVSISSGRIRQRVP